MRRVGLGFAVTVAMFSVVGAAEAAPDDASSSEARSAKPGKGKGKKHKPHRRSAAPLKLFNSCEAVIGYGDGNAERLRRKRYPVTSMPPFPDPNAPETTVRPPFAGIKKESNETTTQQDFSQTNVQVENVDEPDIVKTNGQTIFAIGGNSSLHAIDGRAAQPLLLDSLGLQGFRHELLLVGNRVLVVSQKREIPEAIEPPPLPSPAPPPSAASGEEPAHVLARTTTILSEVDVSNPAAMELVSTQEVDGRYISARLIGSQARIVISTPPAAEIAPLSSLRSALGGWVPYSKFRDAGTGDVTREPVLDSCGEIGRPGKFSGLDMLSVLTIDVAAGLPAIDAEGIMSDGETVYASDGSLYVATERLRGERLPTDPSQAATSIHKFDISQPGTTTFRASGYVRGRILNQFSMDEYEGVLRVASTGEAFGDADKGGNESFVSALKEDADKLALIGRVGNLGRGERIYAVRMFEEKAYVVTFRQVDPLYTLDLSEPGNPKVVGELKILGYSAYLHPLDDDLLIGVGADATKFGSRIGAQVSVFDVGNLKQPKRLAHLTIKGTRTSVEDTHLAFLYWPPTRRAVIPVTSIVGRKGSRGRAGAVGLTINRKKITRDGFIQHSGIPVDEIQRSLVIGDRIFTLSCTGVEDADMTSLGQLGWVPFPDPDVCRPPPPLPFD